MNIQELKTPAELEIAFGTIKELRPHLSFQNFIQLCDAARKPDEYTLVGIVEDRRCLGAMGYRILYDLVHGKHLYIDDLVVTENQRSKGLGAMLLKYADEVAAKLQCRGLRLSTGAENEKGRRFYEREGWMLRSVTYKKNFV